LETPNEKEPEQEAEFKKEEETREIDVPHEFPSFDQSPPLRMIYEDELRKNADKRALDLSAQLSWITFRKGMPINRWLERPQGRTRDKDELKKIKKTLEEYLEIFAREAGELNLLLDMERNYYKEAIALVSKYSVGEKLNAKKREKLKELMIMVDYKDAKLAQQIMQSII
jgi:hypothetical protein